MDKIDKILRKKYRNEKCPKFIAYNKKQNRFSQYFLPALWICAILTVILIKVSTSNNDNNVAKIPSDNTVENVENVNNNLPIASEKLNIPISVDIASIATVNPEIVAVVKVNKIIEYTNYSEKYNSYAPCPSTKLEVENIKLLRGEDFKKLVMYKPGGIISVSDYEKSMSSWENSIYRNMAEEEKENTYIEINSLLWSDMADIKEGSIYLVALKENDYYGGYSAYNFFEYDLDSGKIINKNTKEKEDIPKFLQDYIIQD